MMEFPDHAKGPRPQDDSCRNSVLPLSADWAALRHPRWCLIFLKFTQRYAPHDKEFDARRDIGSPRLSEARTDKLLLTDTGADNSDLCHQGDSYAQTWTDRPKADQMVPICRGT